MKTGQKWEQVGGGEVEDSGKQGLKTSQKVAGNGEDMDGRGQEYNGKMEWAKKGRKGNILGKEKSRALSSKNSDDKKEVQRWKRTLWAKTKFETLDREGVNERSRVGKNEKSTC